MENILKASPDELDRLYGQHAIITEKLNYGHEHRRASIHDPRRVALRDIPEQDAYEVYEEIEGREMRLVAPNLSIDDYSEGTASEDDQIITEEYGSSVVISAGHATDPIRKATGRREGADHGTAGLGSLVAENMGGTILLPVGRQTSNTNVALDHPLKDNLGKIVRTTSASLDLHGMAPGKMEHPFDLNEVHGVLGLGLDPTEETLDLASDIVRRMEEELGLRFVVGNNVTLYSPAGDTPRLRRDDDGRAVTTSLAAKGEGTVTNFVRRQNSAIPVMQLELSRSLRFLPKGMEYRDKEAVRVGVYMGWLATKQMCIMMGK